MQATSEQLLSQYPQHAMRAAEVVLSGNRRNGACPHHDLHPAATAHARMSSSC